MTASYSIRRSRLLLSTGVAALSTYGAYSCTKVVANESLGENRIEQAPSRVKSALKQTVAAGPFAVWVWGSNR